MRLLGIDFGTKRVGVALSDAGGEMAFPHEVLVNDAQLLQRIQDIIRENTVETVVIGESKNYRGEANPVHADASAFAKELETQTDARIVFEPEFLTTAQAIRFQGRTEHTDASAAAIILQSYIDRDSKE